MIKIENIYEPNNFHFITEYPDNKHIEKTITYDCETDGNQSYAAGEFDSYLFQKNLLVDTTMKIRSE